MECKCSFCAERGEKLCNSHTEGFLVVGQISSIKTPTLKDKHIHIILFDKVIITYSYKLNITAQILLP